MFFENYNMDTNRRVFEFSSDLFQGFQGTIDLRDCFTLENIISFARQTLCRYLNEGNLISLKEKAVFAPFHIHTMTIEDIVRNPNVTIWISTM